MNTKALSETTLLFFSATKVILVVTSDGCYIEGDLCSKQVNQNAQEINGGILKNDRIAILSWKDSPSELHYVEFQNQIGSCKPKPRQLTVASLIPQCQDAEKGLLRYRAVIKDDKVLAVLHGDPFYWKPDDGWMKDVLKRQQGRATVEMWENNAGTITKTVKKEEKCFCKLLDGRLFIPWHAVTVTCIGLLCFNNIKVFLYCFIQCHKALRMIYDRHYTYHYITLCSIKKNPAPQNLTMSTLHLFTYMSYSNCVLVSSYYLHLF